MKLTLKIAPTMEDDRLSRYASLILNPLLQTKVINGIIYAETNNFYICASADHNAVDIRIGDIIYTMDDEFMEITIQ